MSETLTLVLERIFHPLRYLWKPVTAPSFEEAFTELEKLDYDRALNIDFTWTGETFNYFKYQFMRGYRWLRFVRGTVGYSELGMHTETAYKRGVLALTGNPENGGFAFVLLEDGTFIEGAFCTFENGKFSLA